MSEETNADAATDKDKNKDKDKVADQEATALSEEKTSSDDVITITRFALESLRDDKSEGSESGRQAESLYRKCELSAKRGEVVLLLGPRGSGKSLLTNYLINITSPLS